jgi:hypothetical protein
MARDRVRNRPRVLLAVRRRARGLAFEIGPLLVLVNSVAGPLPARARFPIPVDEREDGAEDVGGSHTTLITLRRGGALASVVGAL